MGIVTWEVNKEEYMYQTIVGSEVEEKIGMEVSQDGMQMFSIGSDNDGTRILLGITDDEKVNEGNGRGTFKDWVFAIVDESMGCGTEEAGMGVDVEVKEL